MIEFLVGFVGIAVVVSMLWQINTISVVHTRMVIDTRNQLADDLSGSSSQTSSEVDYLKGWDAGPDGADYTQDDTPKTGDASSFLNNMSIAMNKSVLDMTMQQYDFSGNKLSSFSGGAWGDALGLMEVKGETGAIDILPAVQELVTGMDSLNIKKKIFMPVVNNIWDSSGM